MAICPEHGGYGGNSCPKCGVGTGPKLVSAVPVLSTDDKLQLKIAETNLLKAQAMVQQQIKSFHEAQAQLSSFCQALSEKYEAKEYLLNVDTLEFVLRPKD